MRHFRRLLKHIAVTSQPIGPSKRPRIMPVATLPLRSPIAYPTSGFTTTTQKAISTTPESSTAAFLSPEHHNYPNYYHHRNPRSPYDPDRSPVWYVQKLCHHYCEPANPPPRFALSLHEVRRLGDLRSSACCLKKSASEGRRTLALPLHVSTLLL